MPDRGIIHPGMLTALAAFYPSTCTIQEATETRDAAGEPRPTWSNLSGHVSIPCRVAPSTTGRSDEVKQPGRTYAMATYTIALRGYYASITAKHRAVVGGVNYDILAVDHDGQSKTTYLRAERVT